MIWSIWIIGTDLFEQGGMGPRAVAQSGVVPRADLTERLDGGASDRVRAFPIDEGKKTGEFARTGGAAGFLESRDPFADEPCPSAVQPRGAASTLRKVVMRSLIFAAGG